MFTPLNRIPLAGLFHSPLKLALLNLQLLLLLLILLARPILGHPLLPIIIVDVTILAHPRSIQFLMRAIPWLLRTPVFVVAVVAQSFRVVLLVIVSAFVYFFAGLMGKILFFVSVFLLLAVVLLPG